MTLFGFDELVYVTLTLADAVDFARANAAYSRHVAQRPPARTTVVAPLVGGRRVQLDALAARTASATNRHNPDNANDNAHNDDDDDDDSDAEADADFVDDDESIWSRTDAVRQTVRVDTLHVQSVSHWCAGTTTTTTCRVPTDARARQTQGAGVHWTVCTSENGFPARRASCRRGCDSFARAG